MSTNPTNTAAAAQARNTPAPAPSPNSKNDGAKDMDVEADAAADRDRPDEPGSPTARKKQKMYTPLFSATSARVIASGEAAAGDDIKLNFAQRLMELLEKDDVKPVLYWMEDGKHICIEDPRRFAVEVMPKYFSDTKYKSFMVRMKRELTVCAIDHILCTVLVIDIVFLPLLFRMCTV
jgi:hypothetical protein